MTNKFKKNQLQQEILEVIHQVYGNSIRYNLLTNTIELNGKPHDFNLVHVTLGEKENKTYPKALCFDLVEYIAKENSYNPVIEFLDECQGQPRRADLNAIASTYLGTTDPFYDVLMKKHLIGAVKRVYDPGCKKDEALVLHGPQGWGKSTFFRELFTPAFFKEDLSNTDRDGLLECHKSWGIELAELDSLTGKKAVGELKAFLSRASDDYRAPYARAPVVRPRKFVFVGTCNEKDFLRDVTGSRRFWVIEVTKDNVLALEALKRDIQAIWGAAVDAYALNEPTYLTKAESALSSAQNKRFEEFDPIAEKLRPFLSNVDEISLVDVMEKYLDLSPSEFNRNKSGVAKALVRLGFTSCQVSRSGERVRLWKRTDNCTVCTDPAQCTPCTPDGTQGADPSPTAQCEQSNSYKDIIVGKREGCASKVAEHQDRAESSQNGSGRGVEGEQGGPCDTVHPAKPCAGKEVKPPKSAANPACIKEGSLYWFRNPKTKQWAIGRCINEPDKVTGNIQVVNELDGTGRAYLVNKTKVKSVDVKHQAAYEAEVAV